MVGANSRTGYLDLGPSKGAVPGPPKISEAAISDLMLSNAPLFACSSAFFCKTQSTIGAGSTVSLWNGDDDDNAGWTNGQAKLIPNPPLPADTTHTNLIVIVTPIRTGIPNWDFISGDYWQVLQAGAAGNYTGAITIEWRDNADAVVAGRWIWFTAMVISPRRGINPATYPLNEQWTKEALHGGVPSVETNVFPV